MPLSLLHSCHLPIKMRRVSDIPTLRQYLDQSGVLVNGTEEEIKAVRRQYRKLYKAHHKRIERSENKEVDILLSRSREYARIVGAAKKHKQSLPAFIKAATLAYLDKTFIVPDRHLVAKLVQLLSDCSNEVQRITQSQGRLPWHVEEKCDAIEKQIVQLENEIKRVFSAPPVLEEAVRDAMQKDPEIRLRLLVLLTSTPNASQS